MSSSVFMLRRIVVTGACGPIGSTDEVYGDLALDDPARFTEETPYRPSSPYSPAKEATEARYKSQGQ